MKRVLIVRLDAIGDYVLWRNCLRFLRNSAKYKDTHVTVLGNPAWRDLAETFDRDCADEWIWVKDRNELFRRPCENLLPYCIWHRRVVAAQARLKEQLVTYKFDEVISPCAFPDSLLDELVLGIAPVTVSVANGDSSRHASFTRLVDSGSEPFVFLRNRKIASEIGGEPCEVKLALEISDVPQKEKKILFFSDASHWTRRWPSRRWMELSRMLPNGFEAVSAPMGRTLSEFTRFVASCAAVVSNDTMAFHVASALDIPAIGITNGVSGRDSFWPYPSVLGKKSVACVPERLPKIPIPLLGSRLSQYLALSSVSAKSVADGLKSILA